MARQYTNGELLACYIAGQVDNEDRVFVGANLPVPRAGCLLAHLTTSPDLKITLGQMTTNLINVPVMESTKFSTDHRMSRYAESVTLHNDIFDNPRQVSDLFFVGGIQIDQYGNTNLIGTKGDDGELAFRGPGSLGTTTMSFFAKRFYIFSPTHRPKTFVPKCDYISAFGHGEGGDHRHRLGLDRFNNGPTSVITPMAIMDFNTPDHSMRIQSLHPGFSVEEVQDATGFELSVADDLTITAEPTEAQLELLRTRIDRDSQLT